MDDKLPYRHLDVNVTESVLKELLVYEARVREEKYYPPDSKYENHEAFISDIDKLIITFSSLRSNKDNYLIYDDIDIQRGLILFIRMYRYLNFLCCGETNEPKTS